MKNELNNRILSSIILIPIAFFFIIQGSVFFAFFLSIFFLTCSYEWIKMNKNKSIKIFGIIYFLIAVSSAYFLREDFGKSLFFFVIIVCIFTDIGGYIFGKIFKGPKLTKISPKKTYAGMIGSFVLSIIFALVYTKYYQLGDLTKVQILSFIDNNSEYSNLIFLLIILFISSLSQIGDLIISYFKRIAKVKDTGKILPGHGGLLDRVDGIIFAIPILYLIINLI